MFDFSFISSLVSGLIEKWILRLFQASQTFFDATLEVGASPLAARFLCASLLFLVYRHFRIVRMRSALHYCFAYLMVGLISLFLYTTLWPYERNAFLVLLDSLIKYGLTSLYFLRLLSIFLSLHDWRVGVAVHLDFARSIMGVARNLTLFITTCGSLIDCLAAMGLDHWWGYYSYILLAYLRLAAFINQNQKKIQDEISNHLEGFQLDGAWISLIYLSLTFFCLLNTVDTGVDDRFYRIVFTVLLLPILLGVENYVREMTVRLWSSLQDIEHQDNYQIALFLMRAVLLYAGGLVIKSTWGIENPLTAYEGYRTLSDVLAYVWVALLVTEILIIGCGMGVKHLVTSQQEFNLQSRRQKISTLFYFFKLVMGIVRGLTCLAAVLAGLGVSFAQVITNVGIVGAALSFALKDEGMNLFSGLLIILDDALYIGDLVEMDHIMGTVEGIGMRSARIRSIDGTLHFVPFSQIKVLKNRSRDYSFVMLNIAVAPNVDLPQLEESLRCAVEKVKPRVDEQEILMGSLECRGAVDISNERLVYQARIKCSPGKQYIVKRMLNSEIRDEMKARNITIPNATVVQVQACSISNSDYRMH